MSTAARIREDAVDREALEHNVKEMYRQVAEHPEGDFHFEMGRPLAERLGYRPEDLDRIPPAALASFAGVGNPLDLAEIRSGERVLDLGSGSGTDSFIAALQAGPEGRVQGLDMTEAQRSKAERLAAEAGFTTVSFHSGYIEEPPFADADFDVIISNGVINLSANKESVFAAAARVLRPGGRLSISDIVSEKQLPEKVKCDATLWAACIGGAMREDLYQQAIEAAGMEITVMRHNTEYGFLTDAAANASNAYGVKSISLVATRR